MPKTISQNYKTGKIALEDSSIPVLKGGGVLVRNHFSLISAGTEGMKVKEGKMNYLEKAKARPDQVKKVIESVRQQGLWATYNKVMNKLDSLTPLGYSTSGTVIKAGSGVNEFEAGQRVACAGAGYANHADVIFVPKNLVVPVPDNIKMEHAAFTTVGAIAMQGYRQAEMQLGETACVIGLGLLGQILTQILKAAGVHVVGVDIDPERNTLAERCGANYAGTPDDSQVKTVIERLTGGHGADVIFITSGGNNNGPVELAVDIARDRARIVDIGKTKLDLPWKEYYEKELDVRFSRSYGPGRYDPNYEEKGIDYPIGYVRWTERRNMESFLDLIANGRINLDLILSDIYSFEDAEEVYQMLADGELKGVGILFKYEENSYEKDDKGISVKSDPVAIQNGVVKIGTIGAGNYASSMLLPHLKSNKKAKLVEVATATPLSGEDARRKFEFERSSTDYKAMLQKEDIDAVIIATRHNAHAVMTADALRAGKAVFVEKPLAIDLDGTERVRSAVAESGNERLQVGFNRRFSPLVREMKAALNNLSEPLVMNYRVHAGQIEPGSWYTDPDQGGRFVGEAGHFIDVMSFLTDSRPVSVFAKAQRPPKVTQDDLENIIATITYEDGSVGNLLYLTQGDIKVPKEYLEVFGGGMTLQLHNFERLDVYAGGKKKTKKSRSMDKGQKQEMEAFVDAVLNGEAMPISVDSLIDTTLVTLGADMSLKENRPVNLSEFWTE